MFKSKIDVDTCKKGGERNETENISCTVILLTIEKKRIYWEKKESKSRYDVRKRNKVNLPVLV